MNVKSLASAWWNRRHPGQPFPFDDILLRRLPRYLVDRTAARVTYRLHRDQPWITQDAIRLLDSLLQSSDVGLEYGSGGSTLWLAQRTRSVTAIEAYPSWADSARGRLAAAGITNAEVILVEGERGSAEHRAAYVGAQPVFEPQSLDYVFVDGEYRDSAMLRAVELLKPGGLLVLDNSNHFLPHPTRTPLRVTRPSSQDWEAVSRIVESWRLLWTTNGAWDTAIWIKNAED